MIIEKSFLIVLLGKSARKRKTVIALVSVYFNRFLSVVFHYAKQPSGFVVEKELGEVQTIYILLSNPCRYEKVNQ